MEMNFGRISGIIHDIDALTLVEQKALARRLLGLLSSPDRVSRILGREDISRLPEDKMVCPFCGATHVVKKGYADDGVTRRYLCLDCGRSFRRTTNTVLSRTRKDADTWEQFILLTLKGASLETCSRRCLICKNTALIWRHKLLATMAFEQSMMLLGDGIVEMDETFVDISYKGNHSKNKTFAMPRRPHCRGGQDASHHKACVLTAVERGKHVYAEVVCCGSINAEMLKSILPWHLDDKCVVVTDGLRVYDSYFAEAPQEHYSVPAVVHKKGSYHINNINSFHSRFKDFLRGFRGVSTKYLNNYVALFAWLENVRLAAKSKESESINKVLEFGSYYPWREFSTWEREPGLVA